MNPPESIKKRRKWLHGSAYVLSVVVSFLPLISEKPYLPQDTQQVLFELFAISTQPYRLLGIFLRVVTIGLIALLLWKPAKLKRVFIGFFGLDLVLIAFIQSMGETETYGSVIHTGGLAAFSLLGLWWILTAIRGNLDSSMPSDHWRKWVLLPLVVLAFWAPYRIEGTAILPDFNPSLLLSGIGYGLEFCFTAPVFIYFLMLYFPYVPQFAFRITVFNGLLYGLFNLTHWFNPETRWMGFLHIPLLVVSTLALIQSAKKLEN